MTHPGSPVMTPGAWAAMTAWGKAPRGWARVSAGDTSPGVARVPSTAAPATASCNPKGHPSVLSLVASTQYHPESQSVPKALGAGCPRSNPHNCTSPHLSRNLGCGCSCGHSSSWWEASRCGRCKQGHGGCDSLAHPQILATQVKEVHGRHGILRRLGLLILCRVGAAVRATVPGRPGPPTSARPSSPMKP